VLALVCLAAGFAAGVWWGGELQPADAVVAVVARPALPTTTVTAAPVEPSLSQAPIPPEPAADLPTDETTAAPTAPTATVADRASQVAIQVAASQALAGERATGTAVPAGAGGQVGQAAMQPSADSAPPDSMGAALPSDPSLTQRAAQPREGP